MATLIGSGFIEIVPRLSPTFAAQVEGQMVAGTALAGASAAKSAESAGAASGSRFLGGMRTSLAGMGTMVKTAVGIGLAIGVVEFAKKSVDAFKDVAASSLTLQRVMGGTITQASEWSAVADRYGISTGQMSTSLKTLAKDMVSGKGPLVELGIASKDATGHMRPMSDVMMDVADKFQAMPDGAAKSRLAVELFGKSGLALLPILNKGSGGIQELMDAAKKAGVVLDGTATGSMKNAAEAQRNLNEAVKGLEVQFGEKLLPVLTKFVQFLGQTIVPALGVMMGFFEKNGTAVKIFAEALLALIVVSKLAAFSMGVYNNLLRIFVSEAGEATLVTRGLAAAWAFATGPIGLIIAGVAALIAAAVLLWMHWDQVWGWIQHHKAYAIIIGLLAQPVAAFVLIVGGLRYLYMNWDSIWKSIQNVFMTVWHSIDAGLQALMRAWNTVWGAMSIVIGPVWNVIRTLVTAGMAVVRAAIEVGMTAVRAVWGPAWTVMSTLLSAAWVVIKSVVSVGMTLVRTAIEVGMTVVRAVWGPAWAVMSTLLSAAWVVIKTVVTVGMTLIRTVIETALNILKPVWSAAWLVISTVFNAAWVTMKAIVTAALTVIRTLIDVTWLVVKGIFLTVWGLIAAFFKATWIALQLVTSVGTKFIHDTISTVWNAVKAVFLVVWNAISAFFNAIWNALKSIVSLATSWIHATISTVWNAVRGVFQSVWNAISAFFNAIWNVLKSIVNAATGWIHDRITSVWNLVGGTFRSIWNGISGFFTAIWETLKNTARDAVDWIWKHIESFLDTIGRVWHAAWQGMSSVLSTIWQDIVGFFKTPINVIISGLDHFFDPINKVIHWAIGQDPLPHIDQLSTGGRLAGYGGGDKVPAMLEPGEAVVPKHLVKEMAPWANSRGIPGFADGGLVGAGIGPVNQGSWWDDIPGAGVVKNVVGAVAGAAKSAVDLVGDAAKWVYTEGTGLLRIGAGVAAQAILDPLKAVADAALKPMGAPGRVAAGVFDKTTQAIIDWIKGKEGPDPASMGGGSGGGVADSNAVVAFAKTMIGKPYRPPYYDPSGFSCDGLVWYVFKHFGIDLPRGATNQMNAVQRLSGADAAQPGDVVGFHQNGPSAGNPLGLEFHHIGIVSGKDQTINALGTNYGVVVSSIANITNGPGAYNRYGRVLQNLNPGWKDWAKFAATGGGRGGPYTQAQMESAIDAAGAPADIGHIFGAIGMAESGGKQFPADNQFGHFDSPWAMMGHDPRMNTDLLYAAQKVVALWRSSGFRPWETWTNGMYRKFMSEGGLVQSYDTGGYLPTGLSLAYNGTGRPEPVGGGVQNNSVSLTLNVANGDPVTLEASARRIVDEALTALSRRLASGAGRN